MLTGIAIALYLLGMLATDTLIRASYVTSRHPMPDNPIAWALMVVFWPALMAVIAVVIAWRSVRSHQKTEREGA